MKSDQNNRNGICAGSSRRDFFRASALATSALALPGWAAATEAESKADWIRREDELALHLAYFDPHEGPVPNPGMGINAYVLSDHMHTHYDPTDWNRREALPPDPLDRATFDRVLELPYVDNLYLRSEWRDVQKQQGKLDLPEAWKWVLEAAEKKGKRWSFRIMNCSPDSMSTNGLPEFLQGRFKMIPYWHHDIDPGPRPKYFPEYDSEYLNWWGEFVALLGEEFDAHPLLEYVDISGYGFWGEMHHYARYTADGPVINYQPGTPEQVSAIIKRLIQDHLKAFPKTPAFLGLHAADYVAGQNALEQGLCWPRRDGFMTSFSTAETRLAQGLQPGSAMAWEDFMPGFTRPADNQPAPTETLPLPQRYFDIAASFIAMGFSPWDTIWGHEYCRETYQMIEQQVGYRLRPSIVWRRRIRQGANEIVLGLRNDGCSAPPGQLTITARFPDGSESTALLPKGEPTPGALKMYALPLVGDAKKYGPDPTVHLSLEIQIKGKRLPVQWAVKNGEAADPFVLKVPLKTL